MRSLSAGMWGGHNRMGSSCLASSAPTMNELLAQRDAQTGTSYMQCAVGVLGQRDVSPVNVMTRVVGASQLQGSPMGSDCALSSGPRNFPDTDDHRWRSTGNPGEFTQDT